MSKKMKVYIYCFTTIPELVKQYNGNFTIIEKNGIDDGYNSIDVEDYDYVYKENFDNLDSIIDETFQDGYSFIFYSFNNNKMQLFQLEIAKILSNIKEKYLKKIINIDKLLEQTFEEVQKCFPVW